MRRFAGSQDSPKVRKLKEVRDRVRHNAHLIISEIESYYNDPMNHGMSLDEFHGRFPHLCYLMGDDLKRINKFLMVCKDGYVRPRIKCNSINDSGYLPCYVGAIYFRRKNGLKT